MPSLSLGLHQSCGLYQYHSSGRAYQRYAREALKAFRRFVVGNRVLYTCNVSRLKACNRLGPDKDVSIWRTHFFLCSPAFDDASGVVFNVRPGVELANAARTLQIDSLYLKLSPTEVVDVRSGVKLELSEPLVFASDEEPRVMKNATALTVNA